MEPIKTENKQNVPDKVIEKKSWTKPEIEVHDIVEMTQGSTNNFLNTFDAGVGGYS